MSSSETTNESATLVQQAREARGAADWTLCRDRAMNAISKLGADPSDDWIAARLLFGHAVLEGGSEQDIEAAIERVQEALLGIPVGRDNRSGAAHRVLGYLFDSRSSGTRSVNLTLSIDHFRKSLAHYTRDRSPVDWAHVNLQVALSLRDRLAAWADEGLSVRDQRDYRFRRSTVEEALQAVGRAAEVFTEAEHPEEHREVGGIKAGLARLLDNLPGNA